MSAAETITKSKPQPILTVVEPFDDYKRGDPITDPEQAKKLLETKPQHVVRVPKSK